MEQYEAILNNITSLLIEYRNQLYIEQFKNCLEIIAVIAFLIFLFKQFSKPQIREVKSPKVKTQYVKPKKRKRLKYFRRFRIPYRGKTKMYTYDKKHGYIESIWEELNK